MPYNRKKPFLAIPKKGLYFFFLQILFQLHRSIINSPYCSHPIIYPKLYYRVIMNIHLLTGLISFFISINILVNACNIQYGLFKEWYFTLPQGKVKGDGGDVHGLCC